LRIAALATVALSTTGGLETFAMELIHGLAARGHTVDVWVPASERVRGRRFYRTLPGSTRALPPKSAWQMARFHWPLSAYLRLQQRLRRYDVWQVFGAHPAAHIATGLGGRVPTVMYGFGADVQKSETFGYGLRLDPRLERTIAESISKMTRLVAPSQTVVDCFRELGALESRIIRIPITVDLGRFEADATARQTRDRWAVADDRLLILTVGRNHPVKRFDLIPKVGEILRARGLKYRWLVVGAQTAKLDEQITCAGLEGEVVPIPPIAVDPPTQGKRGGIARELTELYSAADCFVLPSDLETFGKVLIEAMAAGTPVVTTDAPGCRDVVEHERTGLSLPRGDAAAMASAIARLAAEPDLASALVRRGRAFAARHEIGVIARQYEEVYNEVIAGRR